VAFGDSVSETIYNKLDPWLRNPPDYEDVSSTYKERGRLNAQRSKLLREIDRVEDDVVIENNNPRSNATRILKLEATKQLRDQLAELEAKIAINDSEVKLLEYRRDMYKVASYQLKVTMDL
jgi:hypothetical protein